VSHFSQGSAATGLRAGGTFNSSFLSSSFLNLSMKKTTKTGLHCQSYHRNKLAFFSETPYLFIYYYAQGSMKQQTTNTVK